MLCPMLDHFHGHKLYQGCQYSCLYQSCQSKTNEPERKQSSKNFFCYEVAILIKFQLIA